MQTLTLEQAVADIINDYTSQGKSFSAHEVTSAIRDRSNRGDYNIAGVPYGYVNAQVTNGQLIEHSDVRDIVSQVSITLDLDVDHGNRAYKVYSNPATTTTTITNIAIPAMAVSAPAIIGPNTRADIAARIINIIARDLNLDENAVSESANFFDDLGADSLDTIELLMAVEEEFKDLLDDEITEAEAESLVTVGQAIDFLYNKVTGASIAVPQRFTVTAPVDIKDHVTTHVREKLQAGVNPTLHQIAKTVRITVEEVRQIVIAAGWTVYAAPGRNPNSVSAMEVK